MEDQLVRYIKYDEYQGFLSRPKKLANSFCIAGYPTLLADGYALDLYGTDKPDPQNTVQSTSVDKILLDAESGETLSEPKYVADLLIAQIFVLFTQGKHPLAVQTKYYNYFYYRYKGCEFRGKDTWTPIGVMHKGRIVGAIMPVVISDSVPSDYDEDEK